MVVEGFKLLDDNLFNECDTSDCAKQ